MQKRWGWSRDLAYPIPVVSIGLLTCYITSHNCALSSAPIYGCPSFSLMIKLQSKCHSPQTGRYCLTTSLALWVGQGISRLQKTSMWLPLSLGWLASTKLTSSPRSPVPLNPCFTRTHGPCNSRNSPFFPSVTLQNLSLALIVKTCRI